MSIISARLKNFKSYEDVEIPEFHQHLNIVLGSNGHGKSNLIKALLFVFSDKLPYNKTEFENVCHKGVAVDVKGNVEVIFELDLKSIDVQILKSERMLIGRRWLVNEGEEYIIDDRIVEKSHFSNVVQCLGLSYSDPYNIIQQGKITQISTMNQHDLYKLLEESTGIRKYMKKKEQGLQSLQKLQREKEVYQSHIQSINQKLTALQSHKKEYQQFELQEGYRKRQMYRHYSHQLDGVQKEIAKSIESLKERNKVAAIIINKKRAITEQLQTLQANILTLNQKLVIYRSQDIIIPTILSQTEIQRNDISLKQLLEKKNQLEKVICSQKKQYDENKQKFEIIKQNFQNLRLQKSLENSGQREKLIQRSIKQYDQQIETLRQSIKSYEKYLEDLGKFGQGQSVLRKQDITSLREKFTENSRSCKIIQTQLQENKLQKILCNRRKNEIMIEKESTKQNFLKESTKLSTRVNQLISFDLINQLFKRKVEGVFGYVVDHLQFQPDVAFAYDIASKNKYFSILVEDESVAKEVIEINKEINGSQINLYTLSHLRRQPIQRFKYPSNSNAQPLNNREWIKIKKHANIGVPADFEECLDKLLNSTLGKYILVQEYIQGLEISKTYHLNCITSKGEVIYAGGTFCKVGEMSINKPNKLLNYSKLLNLQRQLKDLDREDQQITRKCDQLDNRLAQITQQLKIVSQDMKKTQTNLKQAETSYKAAESIIENERKLKQSLFNAKKQIEKKEQLKNNLQSKKNGHINSISKQQMQRAQMQFKKFNKNINQQMEEIFLNEQKFDEISKSISQIEALLQENKTRDEQSRMAQSLTDINAVANLKRQIQRSASHMQRMNVELMELDQELISIQTEIKKYDERIVSLKTNASQVVHKKALLGQEYDISRDVENDRHRVNVDPPTKLRIFTVKDKALFNRYNDYKKQVAEYQNKFNYIEQSETKLREFIARSDDDANQTMNFTVEKFVKYFKEVMKRLDSNTTCDIRLKKLNEKNNKDMFKNGLDIKIGFKSSEGSIIQRKMRELSGGQKTIIAIAFIISLQKCSRSAFYAFDQVDSALDISYAQKIANLLLQLSHESQYFVTTFKPHIISLARHNCCYFQVFSNERVSRVSRINTERALQMVRPSSESNQQEDE